MKTEYAIQGYIYGEKKFWSDAYMRLGDARRDGKQWIDRIPSRTVDILQKQPRPAGHEIGATWAKVGEIKWTT